MSSAHCRIIPPPPNVQGVVRIKASTIAILVTVAEAALLELKDGLNDGLYDTEKIGGIDASAIEQAIAVAKGAAE